MPLLCAVGLANRQIRKRPLTLADILAVPRPIGGLLGDAFYVPRAGARSSKAEIQPVRPSR